MNIDLVWKDGIDRKPLDDLKNFALSCLNVVGYVFVTLAWASYGTFCLMAWSYKLIEREMKNKAKRENKKLYKEIYI